MIILNITTTPPEANGEVESLWRWEIRPVMLTNPGNTKTGEVIGSGFSDTEQGARTAAENWVDSQSNNTRIFYNYVPR